MKDHQITLGKNYDTFAPMGPCLVTADEIPDPTTSHLTLKTSLNGQVMQDSSTADWVFPLPVLLAALNRVMTLEAGDVVSTGCPAGVGFFRHPQVFLKPGDVTRLEIEKIGVLENHVVME
ncbi:MAG: fumarylacetoacetate hydrolase family protein [Burkholderiales bacterium]